MAKVDPFVIQWPRKWLEDNEIRPVIEYLNRFLHDLFIRTGGGTDLIDESAGVTSTNQSDATRLLAHISRLERRVVAVEERDFDGLNAKIARLNRIMETILNELLTEISLLRDEELENKALSVQQAIRAELELLNARVEEAFETSIEEDDI